MILDFRPAHRGLKFEIETVMDAQKGLGVTSQYYGRGSRSRRPKKVVTA